MAEIGDEAEMSSNPIISIGELPTGTNVVFRDSGFFKRNGQDAVLPTPAEVMALFFSKEFPRPVLFESLGLVVKSGPRARIQEGLCLWALRRKLPNLRVPEIYGWNVFDGMNFLYIELIEGVTLGSRLESLSEVDKLSVCSQMKSMLLESKRLRQPPGEEFIGSIDGSRLLCKAIARDDFPDIGPFPSLRELHEYFSLLTFGENEWKRPLFWYEEDRTIPNPRHDLPDDERIVFTHADVHPSNIMVSSDENAPCRVLCLIDWEQSGWYPEYWEGCKVVFPNSDHRWRKEFVPLILAEPKDEVLEAWDWFCWKICPI